MRGVYAYHTKSLHWSDVGYNFLVDRYGTIYEGRYGGITRGVIGAQVLGFNTGSTGISVIGTFTSAHASVRVRSRPSSSCSSGSWTSITWTRRARGPSSAATGRSTPPVSA